MKKTVLLAGFVMGLFADTAFAAGLYDAIYQLPGTQEFYSVHQSGNSLIVGNFITQQGFQVNAPLSNGQQFTTPRLDYWNLFSGPLNGATASLQGEAVFGACYITETVTFSPSGAAAVINSATNTAAGNAQGIDCPGLFGGFVGNPFPWTKVF